MITLMKVFLYVTKYLKIQSIKKQYIWKLCNMAFESVIVSEDWRSTVMVLLYRGKGGRTEYKNYGAISLLSMVGKIYARILADMVCSVTGGLIDDEQVGFRMGECMWVL